MLWGRRGGGQRGVVNEQRDDGGHQADQAPCPATGTMDYRRPLQARKVHGGGRGNRVEAYLAVTTEQEVQLNAASPRTRPVSVPQPARPEATVAVVPLQTVSVRGVHLLSGPRSHWARHTDSNVRAWPSGEASGRGAGARQGLLWPLPRDFRRRPLAVALNTPAGPSSACLPQRPLAGSWCVCLPAGPLACALLPECVCLGEPRANGLRCLSILLDASVRRHVRR